VHKVFQWASGTVGRHAANAVLARADLELVGLHVVSPHKFGKDVGEILGCAPTGIRATHTVDAILASEADVVVHTPLASLVYGDRPLQDLDDICTLLAAGKNVITVVGYLNPKTHGPEVLDRLASACHRGNSTYHSTGLNPGWMGDVLPLAMAGLAGEIERIVVREITNFQFYPSADIMFGVMGFGATPEQFEARGARRSQWLNGLFAESIELVADGLGITLDRVADDREIALAGEDLETAAGTVAQGSVAGQRWCWTGIVDGKPRIVHETVWRMHKSVAPNWPVGKHSLTIEGRPRIHVALDADWISDGLLATALHAVNAIPAVCAAEPGIKTRLDLPLIVPRPMQCGTATG
jgi:hypothetical protein